MRSAFDAIAYWLIDFYMAATAVLIVVAVAQRVDRSTGATPCAALGHSDRIIPARSSSVCCPDGLESMSRELRARFPSRCRRPTPRSLSDPDGSRPSLCFANESNCVDCSILAWFDRNSQCRQLQQCGDRATIGDPVIESNCTLAMVLPSRFGAVPPGGPGPVRDRLHINRISGDSRCLCCTPRSAERLAGSAESRRRP